MGNFFDYEPPDTSNVLVLGLKGSGKTSLLYAVERLSMNEEQIRQAQLDALAQAGVPQPTVRNFEYRASGELNICFTDISGDESVREDWKKYAEAYEYDGVVWVVDLADRDKIAESAAKLAEVMALDVLRNKLLFVVGTKKDLDGALDVGELVRRMKLGSYSTKWTMACSSQTNEGLREAFNRVGREVHRYIRKQEGAGSDGPTAIVPAPVPAPAKEEFLIDASEEAGDR